MFLILNLLLAFPLIVQCERLKGALAVSSDRFGYLYDDLATSYPVIEYKTTTQQLQHQSDYGSLETFSSMNNVVLFNETSQVFQYRPSTDPFEYRIIQYYDSNPSKCLDCEYFKDHYVKLATRLNEIVGSLPEELPFKFKISMHAVSCPHNPELCRKQQVNTNKVPIVRLYPPGQEQAFGYDLHYQSIHPYYVLERLGISSLIQQNSEAVASPELEEHWNVGTSIGQKRKHMSSEKSKKSQSKKLVSSLKKDIINPLEIEYDVNKVIDNFLQNYVHQSISSTDDNTTTNNKHVNQLSELSQWRLKEFIILLHKLLPQNWKVHILLNELLQQFNYIVNDRNYLIQLLQEMKTDGRFVVKTEWSSYCSNHNKHVINKLHDPEQEYSEFTCGFWELLQAVSVGLVDYNEVAFDASERISTHRVMDIVQNTLQTFNGAGMDLNTRTSVLYMYNTCGYNACNRLVYIPDGGSEQDSIQIALWFNEMQNYVNIQLLKRLANQNKRVVSYQEEVDSQQPSFIDCPSCWTTRKGAKSEIIELKNNNMIYKYLKYYYGRQNDSKLIESLKKELSEPAPLSESHIIIPYGGASNNATTSTAPAPYLYNESDHYFTASTPVTNHHQGASTMVVLAVLGMIVRVGMNSSSTRRLSKKPSISNLYDIDDYMHDKQA